MAPPHIAIPPRGPGALLSAKWTHMATTTLRVGGMT